jgi:hypothetical protein
MKINIYLLLLFFIGLLVSMRWNFADYSSSIGGRYIPPSFAELRNAEILFTRTLKGEWRKVFKKDFNNQHFTMKSITIDGTIFTVVQEFQEKRTGRGFYMFRQGSALPIALQAPHRYKDLYTGEIAHQLMREGEYVATAWNTIPRYGKNKRDNFADMAHLENTIFQSFSRAFAQQYPTGMIVQIHGFAQYKRKTRAGRNADLILSDTTLTPSQHTLNIGKCLKSKLTEFIVRIYPYEVREIGGTRNANARDLRAHGFHHFIHVEMSKPLRKQLRKNKQLRFLFNSCLHSFRHENLEMRNQ